VITESGDVIVTSIDHGVLYAISPGHGPTVLAETGGAPNGAALDADGTVYLAQNGGKPPAKPDPGSTGGIQAVGSDGEVTWITQDLVSPNDLCFAPDGSLFVTDPTRRQTRDDGRLWRYRREGGTHAELLRSVDWYPNGIGFGMRDDLLYVADTGNQRIRMFELGADFTLKSQVDEIRMVYGHPDGFAFDSEANLLVCALSLDGGQGEIQVYDSNGSLSERIQPGPASKYTNIAIAADTGLLIVTESDGGRVLACSDWPTNGLTLHPLR
jgi:gluconolactonase